uniref:Replication protein A OB domain-containing protein n=1 Tax=Aegilops tauschii subsp. strangulata TaxID=200361 RepID=A0A453I406_AEGTS
MLRYVYSCNYDLQIIDISNFISLISKYADVIRLLTRMKPVETRITKRNPQPSYIHEIEILMPEGVKTRIMLWGKSAYFLTEDVIGSQTVLIITSTMVQRFNGKCIDL